MPDRRPEQRPERAQRRRLAQHQPDHAPPRPAQRAQRPQLARALGDAGQHQQRGDADRRRPARRSPAAWRAGRAGRRRRRASPARARRGPSRTTATMPGMNVSTFLPSAGDVGRVARADQQQVDAVLAVGDALQRRAGRRRCRRSASRSAAAPGRRRRSASRRARASSRRAACAAPRRTRPARRRARVAQEAPARDLRRRDQPELRPPGSTPATVAVAIWMSAAAGSPRRAARAPCPRRGRAGPSAPGRRSRPPARSRSPSAAASGKVSCVAGRNESATNCSPGSPRSAGSTNASSFSSRSAFCSFARQRREGRERPGVLAAAELDRAARPAGRCRRRPAARRPRSCARSSPRRERRHRDDQRDARARARARSAARARAGAAAPCRCRRAGTPPPDPTRARRPARPCDIFERPSTSCVGGLLEQLLLRQVLQALALHLGQRLLQRGHQVRRGGRLLLGLGALTVPPLRLASMTSSSRAR